MAVGLGPVGEAGEPGYLVLVLAPVGGGAWLQPAHGGRQPALHGVPLVGELFGKGLQLALVLAVEVVLEVHPGRGEEVAHAVEHLGEQGAAVQGGLARHLEVLVLALAHKAGLVALGEAPGHVHVVEADAGLGAAGQGEALEGRGLGGEHGLVGGAQYLLPKLLEEVEVAGTGAQRRLLDDAVDVAEVEVVLGRDLEVFGALLHQLLARALVAPAVALDGGRPLGRDDRVVAVGEHEAPVGKGYGLGAAGTALGDDADDGDAQARHAVDVARYLLGRARVVFDGEGAGREDEGVDRDAFGLGNAHVLPGLGVAPGLGGAAVADLGAVVLFLAYDHDGLGVALLAPAAVDDGAGDEHAGIEAVLVLAAHLCEVVVDVFQNVAQGDALGVPDDADLVHGGDGGRELLLHELEEAFDRGELFVGIAQQVALGPLREVA